MDIPVLHTDRLTLRPATLDDAPDLERICCQRIVAEGVLRVPHPYPPGEAERTITRWLATYERDEAMGWLILWRESGELIGTVGCTFVPDHRRGTVGYLIDPLFWGRGVATEAVRAALTAIFEHTDINKLEAGHWPDNPASGRVLEKCGFVHEGDLLQHYVRFGECRDTRQYGLLRADFLRACRRPQDTADDDIRLVTRRLVLRTPRAEDVTALRRICSSEKATRLMRDFPWPFPPQAADEFIRRARQGLQRGDTFDTVIEYKRTHEIVGLIGARVEDPHDRAEISLLIDPAYWGMGIATESLRRFTAWMVTDRGINRLYASHAEENAACARVLEKAGFVSEGVLRQHDRSAVGTVDAVMWSLLREEYLIGRDGLNE
ncbi:MAG: GNAT N-acetyltransferase [Phycisphaerales bacterium]|nr:GNAT N-acetyltransferase [Phycisphaerales bacterium]